MGRVPRINIGGEIYHAFNRANEKAVIFQSTSDYQLFEQIIIEAIERTSMRLISYCLMPNHWHLVLWPRKDNDLSSFMRWLTLTHVHRYRVRKNKYGYGHLYQGRYKSFLAQNDDHFLTLCRYVERNPLTAGLVSKAEYWQWGSLFKRQLAQAPSWLYSNWPRERPIDWNKIVNESINSDKKEKFKSSLKNSSPYGSEDWITRQISKYKLQTTVRKRGRPKKVPGTFFQEREFNE